MSFGLRALLGLIMCVTPSMGPAQRAGPYIGSSKGTPAQFGGPDSARATLRQFGACAVRRNPAAVRAWLATRLEDPNYAKHGLRIASPDCLSEGMLKIPRANMRGAVFEALYNQEFGKRTLVLSPELRTGAVDLLGPATTSSTKTLIALEQFGECVAKARADDVRALLQTVPGANAESDILARLSPVFSACVPKDEKFSFSKTVVRGALAEGIFWLSVASQAVEAATPMR